MKNVMSGDIQVGDCLCIWTGNGQEAVRVTNHKRNEAIGYLVLTGERKGQEFIARYDSAQEVLVFKTERAAIRRVTLANKELEESRRIEEEARQKVRRTSKKVKESREGDKTTQREVSG